MFTDCKKLYPADEAIFNGKLAHHVRTEIDCESLLSQAGYVTESRRSQTDVHAYEILVVGHCMHIRPEDIKELYLERFNNNNWDEKEEHGDQDCGKKMFLQYANVETEEEGEDDDEREGVMDRSVYPRLA